MRRAEFGDNSQRVAIRFYMTSDSFEQRAVKIFVAFRYNDRDRWVVDLVFPIIRAFSDDVVTGEELAKDGEEFKLKHDLEAQVFRWKTDHRLRERNRCSSC